MRALNGNKRENEKKLYYLEFRNGVLTLSLIRIHRLNKLDV